jgi:hypothetical protein
MRCPSYDVIAYHDPSGSMKHDHMTVLVKEQVSRDQLKELAQNLASLHRPDHIAFVDYQEFLASTPSLGEWRPEDDSGLRDKDWSRRPSQGEVALWEEHMRQEAPLQDIDEEGSIRSVAQRHGISEEEVRDALNKVRSWLGGGTAL